MKLSLLITFLFAPLTLNAWTLARVEIERTTLQKQLNQHFPVTLPNSLSYHDPLLSLVPNNDRVFLRIAFNDRQSEGEVYASVQLAFDAHAGALYFESAVVEDVMVKGPQTLMTQDLARQIRGALPAWLNRRYVYHLEPPIHNALQRQNLQDLTVVGDRLVLSLGQGPASTLPATSEIAHLHSEEPGLSVWVMPPFARF